MKSALKLILALPLLVASTFVYSNEPFKRELYEIADFEIYGVKLGDTGEHVVEQFSKHFSVSRDDLIIDDFGKGIEYVEFKNEEIRVRAWIEGSYDPATGAEIIGSPKKLDLLWINWQTDDYQNFGNELKDKFGHPSVPAAVEMEAMKKEGIPPELLWEIGYHWCEKVNSMELGCEKGHSALWVSNDGVSDSLAEAIMVKNYD